MEAFAHPNVISFHDVFFKKSKNDLCIVMEYAGGGDLEQKINEKKARKKQSVVKGSDCYWSEDEVLDMFTQVCLGLKHVHDRKVLHRDIKA